MDLNWIDAHAPAVQALAAIATLLVTIALAALTARYVELTRAIGRASAEQVQSMRETIAASRRSMRRRLPNTPPVCVRRWLS